MLGSAARRSRRIVLAPASCARIPAVGACIAIGRIAGSGAVGGRIGPLWPSGRSWLWDRMGGGVCRVGVCVREEQL